MPHSMGSVTKGQIYCSNDYEQQRVPTEPLGNGVKEVKNNNSINEAQNEFPSNFKPNLLPTHNEINPCNTPTKSVHQDSFLSKLVEIDEDKIKCQVSS